jgi:hypothetical protein
LEVSEMKIKALLAALFLAGLAASLALASPTKKPKPPTTSAGATPGRDHS